jgi:predicted transcriptional regulator
MLRDHLPDPGAPGAACRLCHRPGCADYHYAYRTLLVAGRSTAVDAPPGE